MNIITNIKRHYPVLRTRKPYNEVLAYWVPIELRDIVLAEYREAGIKIRLRYRGSRKASVGREMPRLDGGTYRRTRNQANQDCLLADATHFTVYTR
jgi:hypothetical protein